jgi:hypothetical protein
MERGVQLESSDKSSYIDASRWHGHENCLNQMFTLYREKVNSLICVYNSLTGTFPIGVMNELRDVMTHMTQSLLYQEEEKVVQHLYKAQRHLKRAVVDAFKYVSMAYSDEYDAFLETYKNVDLSYIDNGELLPKLTRLNSEAEQLMIEAKMIESDIHEDDQMYAAYERCFNRYSELYDCMINAIEDADRLKLRAAEEAKLKEKEHRTDRTIGIIGVAVGVIGVVIGIIGFII